MFTSIAKALFTAFCFGVMAYAIGWHFWDALYDPCAFQWHEGC
jgi:hypothetical protein